jgi:hypothetical protein
MTFILVCLACAFLGAARLPFFCTPMIDPSAEL